jgi:hypothetical protein
MSKNTGRSYHAKKTNRLVNALNSMTLETVLDWLYRSKFALEDGEPLSLKQYLIEIKEVIKAEERIKRIAEEVAVMSDKDKERRRLVLEEEKTEGVGQLIWRA